MVCTQVENSLKQRSPQEIEMPTAFLLYFMIDDSSLSIIFHCILDRPKMLHLKLSDECPVAEKTIDQQAVVPQAVELSSGDQQLR